MRRTSGSAIIICALLLAVGALSPVADARPESATEDPAPSPKGLTATPSKGGTRSSTAPPTCTPSGTPTVVSAQAGIPRVANRPPISRNQTVGAAANGSTTFRLATLDPDADQLVYRIDQAPALGQLTGNAPDLRYTTTATSGTDTVKYTAWDGQFGVTATVTITIGASSAAATSGAAPAPSGSGATTQATSGPTNPAQLQEFDRYLITVPQCSSASDVTSYRIFAFDLLDRGSQATSGNHAPDDVDAAVTLDIPPGQTTATVLVPRRGIPARFRVSARNGKGTGPTTAASAYALAPFTSIGSFVDDVSYRFRSTWTATYRSQLKTTLADPWSYRVGTVAPRPETYIPLLNEVSTLSKNQAPIVRLYMAYFRRMPDLGGLDYWVRKSTVSPKLTLAQISTKFAQSSEFAPFRSLSNSAFVTKVYRDVMGREPDSGGQTYWTNQLNAKKIDRGGVMLKFSDSSENIRNARGYVDLTNLYRQVLGRVPTPDDPGADRIAPVPATTNDAIRDEFRARAIRTVRGLPGYTNGPLRVVTDGLIPGEAGTSYPDVRLDSIGGTSTATRTWSVVGSLPTGMALAADGRLSGTPASAGTTTLTFTVAAGSQQASATLTLRVDPAPPSSCSNPAGVDNWRWTGAAGDGKWETAGNWVHTPVSGSVPSSWPGQRLASDPFSPSGTYSPDDWFAPAYPPPGTTQGASIDPEPITVGSSLAYDDYVCIPAFTPAVSLTDNAWEIMLVGLDNFGDLTVPKGLRLDLSGGANWTIPSTSGGTLTVGGVLSGRGSLTIRSGATMTWHGNCDGAGAMTTRRTNQYRIDTSLVSPHLAGRTIVAPGATVYIGKADPGVCSHPQGINFGDQRILINDGTIRVRGTAYVAADHGTRLDNFGTIDFAGTSAAGQTEGRWVEGYLSGYPGLLGASRVSNAGSINKVSGSGRAVISATYVRPAGSPAVEGTVTSGTLEVQTARFTAQVEAGTTFATGGCGVAGPVLPCPSPKATSGDPQVELVTRPTTAPVTIDRLASTDSVWGYPVELTTNPIPSGGNPISLDIVIDRSKYTGTTGTWVSNVELYYVPSPTTTSEPKLLPACSGSPVPAVLPCYSQLVELSGTGDSERDGDLVATVKTDENSGYGAGKKGTWLQQRWRYRRCAWYRPRC